MSHVGAAVAESTLQGAVPPHHHDKILFTSTIICVRTTGRWRTAGSENKYFTEMCKRFRGGLILKAHRLVYHSTLGLRVIKKKQKAERGEQ